MRLGEILTDKTLDVWPEGNMRLTKALRIGIILFTGLFVPCSQTQAYGTSGFSAKHLLDSADLVCHGKVLSVAPSEIESDTSFHPPLQTNGRVARVQIVNTVKGTAADKIDVVFRMSTDTVLYSELEGGTPLHPFSSQARGCLPVRRRPERDAGDSAAQACSVQI